MAPGDSQEGRILATVRQFPPDLTFALAVLALAVISIVLPVVNQSPLRVLFTLPVVLFIPGYVFIAALFPERASSIADNDADTASSQSDSTPTQYATETVAETAAAIAADRGGIDGIERVALSFGLSIAIVPLIGLVLNFTPWGIRLAPIVLSLSGFILITAYVAARRRLALPPAARLRVPYRQWLSAVRQELLEPETQRDTALNILLILSILLATASVGYAVAVPKQGEAFTEFYLLTESPDGELVADGYPEEFIAGENRTLTVGVGNHEHEPVSYTVVVIAQDAVVENNSTTVLSQQRLDQFQMQVADNETQQREHTVTPTLTGDNIRLTYLLYRGPPPANPTTENAYRELHLWVTVSE